MQWPVISQEALNEAEVTQKVIQKVEGTGEEIKIDTGNIEIGNYYFLVYFYFHYYSVVQNMRESPMTQKECFIATNRCH